MEHTIASLEEAHHVGGGKKEIIKVTIILTILTLVELALGFVMMDMEDGFTKHFIKGLIIILMLVKAFYIVGYFMHLKHEVKNLIMTIVVPLLIFVWFIIAFLYDGNSYKDLRNTYDRNHQEQSTIKATPQEKHAEEGHGEKK